MLDPERLFSDPGYLVEVAVGDITDQNAKVIGSDGKPFTIIKFRTMRVDAEHIHAEIDLPFLGGLLGMEMLRREIESLIGRTKKGAIRVLDAELRDGRAHCALGALAYEQTSGYPLADGAARVLLRPEQLRLSTPVSPSELLWSNSLWPRTMRR